MIDKDFKMDRTCPKCTYSDVNGRIYCEMCRPCVARNKSRDRTCSSSTINDNSEGPSCDVTEQLPVSQSNPDTSSYTCPQMDDSVGKSSEGVEELPVSRETDDQSPTVGPGSTTDMAEGLRKQLQKSVEKVDRSQNESSSSTITVNEDPEGKSSGVTEKLSDDSEGHSFEGVEQLPVSRETVDQSPTDTICSIATVNDNFKEPSSDVTQQPRVSQSLPDLPGSLIAKSDRATDDVSEQPLASDDNGYHSQADERSTYTDNKPQKDEEIRLVLIGRTGAGKSATGNTILNKQVFFSRSSSCSVTKECFRGACHIIGYNVQVIDTPGMFDTDMTIEDITLEVVRCVTMTAPGPHAFIVVIKPDRFTEEEQNTIRHFQNLFGESMQKYMIVLFTKKDHLAADGSSVEEYIEHANNKLKDLLQSCDNRYVAFNNRGTEGEKEQDVQDLLTMVLSMVEQNNGVYTNKMFEEAEKNLKEHEQKLEREHNEKMEQEVSRIIAERDRDMKQLMDSHREEIQALREQIVVLEKKNLDGSVEEAEDLDQLYAEMKRKKIRLEEQMRRIEEAADANIEETKKPQNFRERLREKAAKGGAFFVKNILPVLKWVTDTVVPLVTALDSETLTLISGDHRHLKLETRCFVYMFYKSPVERIDV